MNYTISIEKLFGIIAKHEYVMIGDTLYSFLDYIFDVNTSIIKVIGVKLIAVNGAGDVIDSLEISVKNCEKAVLEIEEIPSFAPVEELAIHFRDGSKTYIQIMTKFKLGNMPNEELGIECRD